MNELPGMNQTTEPAPITSDASRITHHASLLLSLAALGAIFWGTFQLDYPIQKFTRSLQVIWLNRVGDSLGNLGSGGGLLAISAVLLSSGFLLKDRQLWQSGVQTLIAHGAAGLVVQTMKHAIGRPRPRTMRDEEFFTGPSFAPDLDSFPSGHAAASFAIAAVLAKHFPRWIWVIYGLAALIACSRVSRGSHFATDVIMGITVGVLVGSVVARPVREWRQSLTGMIAQVAPGLTIGFAVLWTVCHPVVDPVQDAVMFWTGALALAFGAGSRWGSAFRGEPAAFLPYADLVIGFGLAMMTGSWLVVLIAG